MAQQEAAKLRPLGNPVTFVFLRSEPVHAVTGYAFLITFRAARVVEMIAFDTSGKIAGIDFQIFLPRQGLSRSWERSRESSDDGDSGGLGGTFDIDTSATTSAPISL